MISSMKQCIRCKTDKPVEEFNQDKNVKGGRAAYCKVCRCEYEAERRKRDGERIRAVTRARYANADKAETRIRRRMTQYKVSREVAERVERATVCEWCERPFSGDRGPDAKCLHHCHQTGQYVATLCGRCNSVEGWIRQICDLAGITVEAYLKRIR